MFWILCYIRVQNRFISSTSGFISASKSTRVLNNILVNFWTLATWIVNRIPVQYGFSLLIRTRIDLRQMQILTHSAENKLILHTRIWLNILITTKFTSIWCRFEPRSAVKWIGFEYSNMNRIRNLKLMFECSKWVHFRHFWVHIFLKSTWVIVKILSS